MMLWWENHKGHPFVDVCCLTECCKSIYGVSPLQLDHTGSLGLDKCLVFSFDFYWFLFKDIFSIACRWSDKLYLWLKRYKSSLWWSWTTSRVYTTAIHLLIIYQIYLLGSHWHAEKSGLWLMLCHEVRTQKGQT